MKIPFDKLVFAHIEINTYITISDRTRIFLHLCIGNVYVIL